MSVHLKLRDHRVVRAIHALRVQPTLDARDLASMLRLSTSHFQHLFKTQTGMSVRLYSREVRLQRALELLDANWLSVKQVRNDVGIPDAPNFTRDFRNRFGMTPTKYGERAA